MKNIISILISIVIFSMELSAQKVENCKSCKKQIQKSHLVKYSDNEEKKKIILNNWSEYFFEDLNNTLIDERPNTMNIVDLKFISDLEF